MTTTILEIVEQQQVEADVEEGIAAAFTEPDRTGLDASQILKHITADDPPVTTYHLADNMYWDATANGYSAVDSRTNVGVLDDADGADLVIAGLKIVKADDTLQYLPMHAGDGATFKFYGFIDSSDGVGVDGVPGRRRSIPRFGFSIAT